jgi:hypothetical protein
MKNLESSENPKFRKRAVSPAKKGEILVKKRTKNKIAFRMAITSFKISSFLINSEMVFTTIYSILPLFHDVKLHYTLFMAFSSRNSLLTLFFIIGISLTVIFCINIVVLPLLYSRGYSIDFFEDHPFWFTYNVSSTGFVPSVIGMALLAAIGFAFLNIFRVYFKKTGQAEIFFVSLFFFSLLPETLRLGVMNIQLLDLPKLIGIILSRVVIGSRIFGLLCLFFGSLYALDFQYQKFEIVVSAVTLVSFLLTFSIPLDSQLMLTNGLFKMSDEQGLFILYSCLVLFIVATYLITIVRGRSFFIFAGVCFLLIAREILFFALSPWALICGSAVFIIGGISALKGFESHFSLT